MPSSIPAIGPESTNHEVRVYIAALLQKIDADITNERAWEMTSQFIGDGAKALKVPENKWQELFGVEHGLIVYERITCNQYVDKDTIWPILRHLYRTFILLLVIRTGRSFFEQGAFTIDESWNTVAFVYFIIYGFAYIITSAKSIDKNPFWPEYFKIRPMGPNQKSWLSTLGYGG